MHCPLCQHSSSFFYQDKQREYYRCTNCQLVFVPKHFHLSASSEKATYDKHENNSGDLHYLQFLNRLAAPLLKHLNKKAHQSLSGLDFGCGPGPGLATMLQSAGHSMSVFDLFYANNPETLARTYDFVTCTEVIEHFNNPAQDVRTLFEAVKQKGALGIMTKLVISKERFANWHYKNDPTHVSFFCKETFEYLCEQYQYTLIYQQQDAIILNKK